MGWLNLDFNVIVSFLACIIFIFIFGKIFILPIKSILKLIFNSILGGTLIFLINIIGTSWNFHVGLNILTSVIIGLLGIPGALLLVILKIIVRMKNMPKECVPFGIKFYSTVTDFARFLGLSTSKPLNLEI